MKAFHIDRTMPLDVGILHFVGIGGIGMSGIAELLHNLGYRVQGSDMSENANVQRLRSLGIEVAVGHRAENLGEASVVIKSTAVQYDNPEIVAAREAQLPVLRRSEMLTELMRLKMAIAVAGTHGKTTTTSIVSAILHEADFDPTVINGGIINSYGTNVHLGQGDWMVVEADESDGTFLKVPSCVAVVTNIDPEHLDHYGSFDALREAFRIFIHNVPFYGFAVACIDHPEVQNLVAKITDRRVITYGTSPQADVQAMNITSSVDGSVFDVVVRERGGESRRTLRRIAFPVPGMHNVRNCLAGIAVANELEIPDDVIFTALAGFRGVKRRFTKTGEVDGVTIIDDYGHHPVEIAATLSAARAFRRSPEDRVIAVVQPHRYTRLRDLFDQFCTCFNDADMVVVADVYEAGETPIEGFDRDALVEGLKDAGHRKVVALEESKLLAETIRGLSQPGDLVICLGAGSISQWANQLPAELEKLHTKDKQAAS